MRDSLTDAAEGTKSTKAAAGDDEQVDTLRRLEQCGNRFRVAAIEGESRSF